MRSAIYQILMLAVAVGCDSLGCASQPLSPAQALAFIRISDLHFSPDGSRLAYVVSSYQWDALPRVRVVDVVTGTVRELTPAQKSERSPQWAPDGKTLAFLSNRGGQTQVYTMAAAGGEAVALTAQKFAVERFQWSPDGRHIAYIAKDDAAPDDQSGPQVADLESNLSRLWVIDSRSKATRSLGKAGYRIDDLQWLNDTRLLVAATDTPAVEEYTDGIYRVSLTDGTMRLAARPPQPFEGLLASPDGREFVVRSTDSNGPIARDLFSGSLDGKPLRRLSAPLSLAVVDARWHEPGAIWVLALQGFYRRLFRLTRDAAPVPIGLPLSVASFDVSRDGLIAFVGEDFDRLPEIYLCGQDDKVRRLTQTQQGWDGISLASTSLFQVTSSDGLAIEAALMSGAAAEDGKLPLVLLVHGGPASNFTAGYGWQTAWAQLLATHGYQVLMVNPRGSNGYSEDFTKANRGDWGGGDYRDLMTALDAVVARGHTDVGRLGIGGWSYGGEMTVWAITQSDRFKAAVAGAPVFDQQAEFETERDPADDEWYFGTPWQQPEVFARNSPSTYIRNAHTPTLILAGEDDASNPVGQSKGLYRALKHFGVETELVLYPGEGHSPRRGAYNIDMFQRILAWYDRHLQRRD